MVAMTICFHRALMAAAMLVSTPVMGQGRAPVQFYQSLAKGAGKVDGLSVACGKVGIAAAQAHRAKLRQDYAAKGLAPETFDQIYDGAYTDVVSKGEANPAQLKDTCAQVAAMGSPGR